MGWVRSIVKIAIFFVLLNVIVLSLIIPCLFQCIQKIMQKAINQVFIVEEQEGVIMGSDIFSIEET